MKKIFITFLGIILIFLSSCFKNFEKIDSKNWNLNSWKIETNSWANSEEITKKTDSQNEENKEETKKENSQKIENSQNEEKKEKIENNENKELDEETEKIEQEIDNIIKNFNLSSSIE